MDFRIVLNWASKIASTLPRKLAKYVKRLAFDLVGVP